MAVITGIVQGIKIAQRIERKYRYLDPTNKFIQKFVPPPYRDRARYIKDILITGGVIYDPILEIYRAFQKPRYQQDRQARIHMDRFGNGRKFGTTKKYRNRRRCRCKNRFY